MMIMMMNATVGAIVQLFMGFQSLMILKKDHKNEYAYTGSKTQIA